MNTAEKCRKEGNMKKKKNLRITASALIAGLYAAGCTFSPDDNEPQDVYGPPVIEEEPQDDQITETEIPEETYVPDVNVAEGLYGPPPIDDDADYDPGDNVAEPLYGPPAGQETR